jgi:hypothetical protein
MGRGGSLRNHDRTPPVTLAGNAPVSEGFGMSMRCGIRAIGEAMTAVRLDTWNPDIWNPGAALLLTLLLTSP